VSRATHGSLARGARILNVMSYQPTEAEVLAAVAMGGFEGSPSIQAVALTRAGHAAQLAGLPPLLLVDVIRFLAILGEHALVDRAYAAWAANPHGAVHFEAGLAALMVPNRVEAEARLERAVAVDHPQPMAWNSLAILRLARGHLDTAIEAIETGLIKMPGDRVTAHTAAMLFALRGDSERAGHLRVGDLHLLLERFPGHAQIADAAALHLRRMPRVAGVDFEGPRAQLARRARELDPRLP